MRDFILDSNPKFSKSKVVLKEITYSLTKLSSADGNGYAFTVYKDNLPIDQTHFTYDEVKAFFLLVISNNKQ